MPHFENLISVVLLTLLATFLGIAPAVNVKMPTQATVTFFQYVLNLFQLR